MDTLVVGEWDNWPRWILAWYMKILESKIASLSREYDKEMQAYEKKLKVQAKQAIQAMKILARHKHLLDKIDNEIST